jgi:hypothetical protein
VALIAGQGISGLSQVSKMLFRTGALIGCAFSLLALPAVAAAPPKKPVKAAAAKSAPAKPVVAKPAAAKPAVIAKSAAPAPKAAAAKPAAKPVYKLPTGTASKQQLPYEPPPGVRVDPVPGTAAAAPAPAAAKPVAQAAPAKPKAKKTAKAPGKKKRQIASKGGLKNGRAALTPMEKIDQGQLATDHLANAETKSTLDLLASYKETLREGDLETAGVLLRLVLNEKPTHELVTVINDLLGMPLDTQDTEILIELGRAERADAVASQTVSTEDQKVSSPLGERIHAAHAAIAVAPHTSRLQALAAYKQAVTEENSEAAAVALSGVVLQPIDEASVNKANALLGLKNIITPGQLAAAN